MAAIGLRDRVAVIAGFRAAGDTDATESVRVGAGLTIGPAWTGAIFRGRAGQLLLSGDGLFVEAGPGVLQRLLSAFIPGPRGVVHRADAEVLQTERGFEFSQNGERVFVAQPTTSGSDDLYVWLRKHGWAYRHAFS